MNLGAVDIMAGWAAVLALCFVLALIAQAWRWLHGQSGTMTHWNDGIGQSTKTHASRQP